ncbi:MAG: ECF-type sigma factor [Rhodothermales bacterium]
MSTPPVTAYLDQARLGDKSAFDALFNLVYDELNHLARKVRSDRPDVQMSTVSLVHESYAKLLPAQHLDWKNRVHFYRVAARAMRQVLVNAAERQHAAKRGGDAEHITLEHFHAHDHTPPARILALDEALNDLERMNERQAHIVEYRIFCGFTIDETAHLLEVSAATVKRDWLAARAWLRTQLDSA